jgi:hypothetical protein
MADRVCVTVSGTDDGVDGVFGVRPYIHAVITSATVTKPTVARPSQVLDGLGRGVDLDLKVILDVRVPPPRRDLFSALICAAPR